MDLLEIERQFHTEESCNSGDAAPTAVVNGDPACDNDNQDEVESVHTEAVSETQRGSPQPSEKAKKPSTLKQVYKKLTLHKKPKYDESILNAGVTDSSAPPTPSQPSYASFVLSSASCTTEKHKRSQSQDLGGIATTLEHEKGMSPQRVRTASVWKTLKTTKKPKGLEVEALRLEMDELQERYAKAEAGLIAAHEKIDQLSHDLAQLQEENSSNVASLRRLHAAEADATEAQLHLKELNRQVAGALEGAYQQVAELTTKGKELEEVKRNLQEQVDSLEGKNHELEEANDEQRQQLLQVKAQLVSATAQVAELRAYKEEALANVLRLKEGMHILEARNAELMEHMAAAKTRHAHDLKQLQDQRDILVQQCRDVEEERDALVEAHTEEVGSLRAQLDTITEEAHAVKAMLEDKCAELKKTEEVLQEEITKEKVQVSLLQHQCDELRSSCQKHKLDRENVEVEQGRQVGELMDLVEELRLSQVTLTGRLAQQQADIDEITAQHREATTQYKQLQEKLRGEEERLGLLEEENNRLKTELSDCHKELTDAQAENQKLQQENDLLSAPLRSGISRHRPSKEDGDVYAKVQVVKTGPTQVLPPLAATTGTPPTPRARSTFLDKLLVCIREPAVQ